MNRENKIFVICRKNKTDASRAQEAREQTSDSNNECFDRRTKTQRNTKLMPIPAGVTAATSEAKTVPRFNPMNSNAMTIVVGIVPIRPPIFVPYRSATIVISMTTRAEKKKEAVVWKIRESIETGIDSGYKK